MGKPFQSAPSPETLTPRERDILRLIAAGYSNREIASVLRMSEGAVKKSHVQHSLETGRARPNQGRASWDRTRLGLVKRRQSAQNRNSATGCGFKADDSRQYPWLSFPTTRL
jgi:hypothetical protein